MDTYRYIMPQTGNPLVVWFGCIYDMGTGRGGPMLDSGASVRSVTVGMGWREVGCEDGIMGACNIISTQITTPQTWISH